MKKIKALMDKIRKKEQGAVVVEATISLTAFIFAIFIILSIVDICYVQAKMGIALNSAAKEMSQYAYLYEALGISDHMTGEGGKSSDLMKSFSQFLGNVSKDTEDFSATISNVFKDASDQAAGDSAAEYLNNGLGMGLANALVKKNLKSYDGDNADAFLRRCHVKGGMSGLNFLSTTFLTNKDQNMVNLVVMYEVEVIRLLDTSFTFKFIQKAETKAWTKGVSVKDGQGPAEVPSSIWDSGPTTRGNSIITSEKKNYKYTSSGNGFHAFDSSKNQFIKIRTINTFDKTYATSDGIKKELRVTLNSMKDGVENLEEKITVQKSEKDVTVTSNPDTRSYKLVLVVPDSSDMNKVNQAISDFKKDNPGVDVEVKTGYGDPAAAKKTETQQTENKDAA